VKGESYQDGAEGRGEDPSAMAAYVAGLKAGRFLLQRCNSCERHIFYPRVVCPHCASTDIVWLEPSGLGSVYSTTIVNRSDKKGGHYNVALIDLAEGVRLMSRVDGIAPDKVHIGMQVQVAVADVDGIPAPVFRPVKG
jgi:uncharacterized OB-fold protein